MENLDRPAAGNLKSGKTFRWAPLIAGLTLAALVGGCVVAPAYPPRYGYAPAYGYVYGPAYGYGYYDGYYGRPHRW